MSNQHALADVPSIVRAKGHMQTKLNGKPAIIRLQKSLSVIRCLCFCIVQVGGLNSTPDEQGAGSVLAAFIAVIPL